MSQADRITTAPAGEKPDTDAQPADWAEDSAQMDGPGGDQGGGTVPDEFEVEVKLIDANSPLYSVKSFDELGL